MVSSHSARDSAQTVTRSYFENRAAVEARRAAGRLRRGPSVVGKIVWLAPSVGRCLPYTMVRPQTLFSLGRTVQTLLDSRLPGVFVECGVWRGGASFLMADVLRRRQEARTVWMLDSFEGMPDPEEIDGLAALNWAARGDPGINDARASIEEVEAARQKLGLADLTRPVKGWFDQVLPEIREEIGLIALLRLDCDWYASVKTCLENLYDQVVPGGYVLLDDYYTFEGAALATHQFLTERRLPHRIRSYRGGAFFVKQ